MFNSQKINTDPHPYVAVHPVRGVLPWRYSSAQAAALDGATPERKPRHEFDNNPNQILEAFREYAALENFGTLSQVAIDRWASAFASFDEFGGYSLWEHPSNIFHAFTTANADEIAHARKVLGRLAAL